MLSRIKANFFTGTFLVVPLIITFWVLYFIIDKLNLLLLEPIISLLNNLVPSYYNIEVLTKITVFILLLALLTIIGFATRIIIVRNIFGFGEKVLFKVPMINIIYRTMKEISLVFLAQKDTMFKKVVLIEYPKKDVYQLGFVVSETKGNIKDKLKRDSFNVFVPTAPNPTSGMLVIIPRESAIPLDISVAEGMKMVISGGAVVPKINYGHSKDRCCASEKERL